MSALFWLIGLTLLLVVLFLLALLTPVKKQQYASHATNRLNAQQPSKNSPFATAQKYPLPNKKLSGALADVHTQLSGLLPECALEAKQGEPARILVRHQAKHCATVVLSDQAATPRTMGDVLILTIHPKDDLTQVANQIRQVMA